MCRAMSDSRLPLILLTNERLRLRPVSRKHRARIIRCLKGAKDYRRDFTEHKTSAAWADALLEEMEIDRDRRLCLLESPSLEPVGLMELVRDAPEQVTIALLVVHASARMTGVGKLAVTMLAQHFESEGIGELALGVVEKNLGALSFWEALGFARTGHLGTERDRLVTMSRSRGRS
jgi:ribosomal protein S18 acetylase RimI-like enzyme